MQKVIHFISNHLEHILAITAYWIIAMIVIMIAVRVRHVRLAHIQKILKQIAHYGLIVGEASLVILMLYIFATNYEKKVPLDPEFSSLVLGTTDWVKEDLTIYFINENTLVAVKSSGLNRRDVFKAPDEIREYHFSPDGKHVLIVTEKDLFQYNLRDKTSEGIASLKTPLSKDFKGVISGIQWDPASQKYCYRIARWTPYSSQEAWYVYDIKTKKKRSVRTPTRRINSLDWGQKGENLYYSWFDALDTTVRGNPYEVKVYEISLVNLKPKLVLKFPFHEPSLSADSLALHGINLFDEANHFSFGRAGKKHFSWQSAQGPRIGIDEDDHLYYVRNRWWRKRLYKIPRIPVESDMPRYQYQGGRLVIQHLRWLPSGRYVIMEHYFFGILILEPSSGKIGILASERGSTFGWYI